MGLDQGVWKAFRRREENICQAEGMGFLLLEGSTKSGQGPQLEGAC